MLTTMLIRIFIKLLLLPLATAYTYYLHREGAVSDLVGYLGLSYQAIRYEPLCGTLGTDERFDSTIRFGVHCGSAGDAFGNNSASTLAFYDTTGVELQGAIVGNGIPLCMCFALGRSDGFQGNLCLYVDGAGMAEPWWDLHLDDILGGDYRPSSGKSLPLCVGANISSLRKAWSATAVMPSNTGQTSSLGMCV
jgi:hypothetical protein